MKINEIEPKILKIISKLELLSLHRRVHQLYGSFLKSNPEQANEQLVNAHIFIMEEMIDRGIKHNADSQIDRDGETIKKMSEFAPVLSDKQPDCKDKITWNQIKEYFNKSFLVSKNTISIVGGVACNASGGNDIDILIKLPSEKQLLDIVSFRIYRMLPPDLRNRIHIFELKGAGPFTDHLNIGDLMISMNSNIDVVKMQEKISAEKSITSAQADESAKEDLIVPGRFFQPMKPTKAHNPGERQTVEKFLEMFTSEDYPVYSSIKRDGIHGVIHKNKDRVWIFTEDGSDVTDKLPSLVSAILDLKYDTIVLDCELELWPFQDGARIHWPREEMSARLLLTIPDDADVFAQCFAILYIDNNDIHKKSYEEIYQIMRNEFLLGKLHFLSNQLRPRLKINLIHHEINEGQLGLKNSTELLRMIEFSEGNVAKKARSVYNLHGLRSGWVKYHNNAVAIAQVADVILASDGNSANLALVLRKQDALVQVGRSFNVPQKQYSVGQLVLVEYETLNHTIEDGIESYSLWAPRVVGIQQDVQEADTIEKTIQLAIESHVYQKKVIINGVKSFFIK